MLIAILNESKMVSNNDIEIMCKAIQIQLDTQFLPSWNLKSATVKFCKDIKSVPANSCIMNILDNTTQAGALGYHTEEQNGLIDGFIFAEPVLGNGGVVLYDPRNSQNVSVASVLSHEVLELIGNEHVNLFALGPEITANDGKIYNEYAFEMCDPVENTSYTINADGYNVSVSNFVLPHYFDVEAVLSSEVYFDYLKQLKAPYSMLTGGYLVIQQSGNSTQIFGEHMQDWKKEMKKSEFSRASRRMSSKK